MQLTSDLLRAMSPPCESWPIHALIGTSGERSVVALELSPEGGFEMFAAYTDDTIWSIEETEEEARSEGEAMMMEMGAEGRVSELKVAPIDDDLVDALEEAEESGDDVLFDLIDGMLCEVEAVEAEGEAA